MNAWIAGSSGLIGTALVRQLSARAEVQRITSLVRRTTGTGLDNIDERVVDFERLEEELGSTEPAPTHVFCCLGTTMAKAGSQEAFERVDYEYPLALARVAARREAEAFLIVTALGADARSKLFYNRVKGRLEEALRGVGLRRLRIFQPSLLLGDRPERRLGERVGAALARPLAPLFVGGLRKYRPIAGDAVARAMVAVALRPGDDAIRAYPSDSIEELAHTLA